MEQWKSIKNYEGLYEVSTSGNVRSLRDNRGNVREIPLTLSFCVIGHKPNNLYFAVNLYKDKKMKQRMVHRLVAETFLPNPGNLPLVNHKDENTFNANLSNLEWCTHQYNQEYSLSKKLYRFIDDVGETYDVFNVRKFARENGYNHAHLYQVHLGKMKSHKGMRKRDV